MTWFRSADASMVWALEAARIYLAILGCAAAGCAMGFGMGYRRGVNHAINSTRKHDHRLDRDRTGD
jgi:hypothetical protein